MPMMPPMTPPAISPACEVLLEEKEAPVGEEEADVVERSTEVVFNWVTGLAVELGVFVVADDSGEASANADMTSKVSFFVTSSNAHPGTTVSAGIPGGNLGE